KAGACPDPPPAGAAGPAPRLTPAGTPGAPGGWIITGGWGGWGTPTGGGGATITGGGTNTGGGTKTGGGGRITRGGGGGTTTCPNAAPAQPMSRKATVRTGRINAPPEQRAGVRCRGFDFSQY